MKRAIKSADMREDAIRLERSMVLAPDIVEAENILIDNGIPSDEAYLVLQAIGYALLDTELYPDLVEE